MEKYEDYLDKWLGGLESEIAFWKRYMETKGDIYYDTFKNQTEKDRHFTLERYLDGFSKTEQIKFIDIGSGPFFKMRSCYRKLQPVSRNSRSTCRSL